MRRNPLGRSGCELTELGFGGAGVFCSQPRAVAEGAFAAAWDAGIRYFDTAPFYGHGLSERRMGDCLRPLPRDSYVLSTKVGRLLRPGPSEQTPPNPAPGQLPFGIRLDYSLRRRHALDRGQPAAARPRAHRHRLDPRRQPALARRAVRTPLRRDDGGRLPRARAAARGRHDPRLRGRREGRGGLHALRPRGRLRRLHAGRRLFAAQPQRPRRAPAVLCGARHQRGPRGAVQLRHPRDRRRPGRDLLLRARPTRDHGAHGAHRGDLPAARRRAGRCRAQLPADPPGGRERRLGLCQPGGGRGQRRQLRQAPPAALVGGSQARGPDSRRAPRSRGDSR